MGKLGLFIKNSIKRGCENNYFPLTLRINSSPLIRNPPQNENILFLIKYRYTKNNSYAILIG